MVAGGDCTVVAANPCRTFYSRLQTTLKKKAQKRRGLCERTARQLSERYLIIPNVKVLRMLSALLPNDRQ